MARNLYFGTDLDITKSASFCGHDNEDVFIDAQRQVLNKNAVSAKKYSHCPKS